MSTPKWTPGPWLREGLTIYALEHDGWRKGVETFRNRFYLRVQAPHTTPHVEEEAVAAVAAASPLLYAALELIQWGDSVFDPNSGENGTTYQLCPRCDQSEVRGHAPDCEVGIALATARGEA